MTADWFRFALALATVATLSGCKEKNAYVPPPLSKVTIANPEQQKITRYLELTGNTAAVNSVDLVARVEGFLEQISYVDGTAVKKGDQLFVIEPLLYLTKLQQAQAAQEGAQAVLANAQTEQERAAIRTLACECPAGVTVGDPSCPPSREAWRVWMACPR